MNNTIKVVNAYYDAWRNPDFSNVKFTKDFKFHGPIDQFDSSKDFIDKCQQVSKMVTAIDIKKQFTDSDGNVCTIYDFVTELPIAPIPTAEWITVEGDSIKEIKLFYDATKLREFLN